MSKTTIDHDEIRAWAKKHGAVPAAVDRTHEDGDVGIIRLMFPKARQSEHGSLVEIGWDDFFEQFEESGLALIIDETSNFNKFVGRDTAERRAHGENDAARHKERDTSDRAGRGEADRNAKSSAKSAANSKDKSTTKSSAKSGGEDADLKSREYRDADGVIHHHTRAYMEGHGKDQR